MKKKHACWRLMASVDAPSAFYDYTKIKQTKKQQQQNSIGHNSIFIRRYIGICDVMC